MLLLLKTLGVRAIKVNTQITTSEDKRYTFQLKNPNLTGFKNLGGFFYKYGFIKRYGLRLKKCRLPAET